VEERIQGGVPSQGRGSEGELCAHWAHAKALMRCLASMKRCCLTSDVDVRLSFLSSGAIVGALTRSVSIAATATCSSTRMPCSGSPAWRRPDSIARASARPTPPCSPPHQHTVASSFVKPYLSAGQGKVTRALAIGAGWGARVPRGKETGG
jgi:hypothetical protein